MSPPTARNPRQQVSMTTVRREALKSLIARAERRGLALSRPVRDNLEAQAESLFDYATDAPEAIVFASDLKKIAVRLVRQRRYREANARFRLASRFNPADPTLISNRATCMYNLAKYRKCIQICLNCLKTFPKLSFEDPRLYCKLMIRKGRASIELENFDDATDAHDLLVLLRDSTNSHIAAQVSQKEFQVLIDPFIKHLEAKLTCPRNRLRNVASGSSTAWRTQLGREKNGGDDGGSSSESEGDDDNLDGLLGIENLCPHLNIRGSGPCDHPYSEHPTLEFAGNPDQYGEPGLTHSGHSEDGTLPSLLSSERDDSLAPTDSDMPDLVSGEDTEDSEYSQDDSDGSIPAISPRANSPDVLAASTARTQSNNTQRHAKARSVAANSEAHVKEDMNLGAGEDSQASATGSSSSLIPFTADSFKRGFLAPRPKTPPPEENPRSPFSPSVIAAHAKLPFKVPSLPPEIAALELRGKSSDECYESDDERGPRSAGLLPERKDEHREITNLENSVKGNGSNHSMVLRSVLKEVMGKSFRSTRAVDFARTFGSHVASAGSSKRKNKVCDKSCANCYARKMWKMRFISNDLGIAKQSIKDIESDSRKERRTFLARDLWQGTGYYASGYEMAFDVPALVHGVAFLCHLQSELYWRGDKVPLARDTQHKFISALELSYRASPNKEFLFMLFIMIRNTANLFGLFPDPFHHGDKDKSFQFSKSASVVAQKSMSVRPGESEDNLDVCDTLLASRTEDVNRNAFNWARIGQVTREEEWIYHILLRDVSHLMLRLMTPIPSPPMYLEPGESFSDAFERACGERSANEKYWRCRIVTIVDRTRHRLIERTAQKMYYAGNIEKCTHLLSHAITGRPRQPRLFLKRALVHSLQEKWKESLRDVNKGITLCDRGNIFITEDWKCNPPDICCKVELLIAQSDIFLQQAMRKEKRDADCAELLRKAHVCLQEAMACKPVAKKKTNFLEERIETVASVILHTPTLATPFTLPSTPRDRSGTGGVGHETSAEDIQPERRGQSSIEGENVVDSRHGMSAGGRKSIGKQKKRKSKKAQHAAVRKPAPARLHASFNPVMPENISSSSDDETGPALAGNPYAALLDEEHAPVNVHPKSPAPAPYAKPHRAREETQSSTRHAALLDEEHVPVNVHPKSPAPVLPTEQPLAREEAQRSTRHATNWPSLPTPNARLSQASAGGSSFIHDPSSRLNCGPCGFRFYSQSEFDIHTRSRQHRATVAHSRAAGQTAVEWRGRSNLHAPAPLAVRGRAPPTPQYGTDRERNINNPQGRGPTREAPQYGTDRERGANNLQGRGPTREEALAEVERAVALLGGEARPCDIISRLRFSKWNIIDANGYLDRNFGGLLRLCLQGTNMFEIRAGTESRPVLAWIHPTERRSDRLEVNPSTPRINQFRGVPWESVQRSSTQREKSEGRSTSSNLTKMLQDQLRVSSRKQRRGDANGRRGARASVSADADAGLGECGICLDNAPDIRLIPCGHQWCTPCIAENIINRGREECPVCQQNVQRTELLGEVD